MQSFNFLLSQGIQALQRILFPETSSETVLRLSHHLYTGRVSRNSVLTRWGSWILLLLAQHSQEEKAYRLIRFWLFETSTKVILHDACVRDQHVVLVMIWDDSLEVVLEGVLGYILVAAPVLWSLLSIDS